MKSISRQDIIKAAKYLVVKVGTNVLTTNDGRLNRERIRGLINQICAIRKKGVKVVLVSSGAVGAGMGRLGLDARPKFKPELQAVAAIGQSKLIQNYEDELATHGVLAAQLLLTAGDLANRTRYLNVNNTFYSILKCGALPIVNENDAVSSAELNQTFGDNDRLASLVANLFPESLLVLLTDVDGLYDGDPALPDSKLVPSVCKWSAELMGMVAEKKSGRSKGGMSSKLKAAKLVTSSGGAMIIANGDDPNVLSRIYAYEEVGTLFYPCGAMSARKRWMHNAKPCGTIVVDNGAARAIEKQGRSLLPIGALRALGNFKKGDVVEIVDMDNRVIAHGLTNYGSEDAQKICRKRFEEIASILGHDDSIYEEIVHRNNIQLSEETT